MRYCLKEVCYCPQPCASSYPCGSYLSMIVQVFLGAKVSNYKILGKLSVLKMAIEEQDFSSVLEQAEQHGCEIDEC